MLVASALNMLTTRSQIDTVICLQTRSAEQFFHHDQAAPDALRIRLSPVFTALRQVAATPSNPPAQPNADSVVDRLAKLADLRQQGLLTEAEFAQAKAHLLGGGLTESQLP
jgi:hypothetical protein